MGKNIKKQQTKKEKKRAGNIKKEVRKRTAGYIIAGFALVGGFAWDDAIRSTIEVLFPKGGTETILAKFTYAIVVTIFIVVVSLYITKILVRDEEESKE